MDHFYVYILFSTTSNKYYVGQTQNLQTRLEEHNNGKGGEFTSKHMPWNLMYHEIFKSRVEAVKREKEIKNKKSRKYIEWLISKPW